MTTPIMPEWMRIEREEEQARQDQFRPYLDQYLNGLLTIQDLHCKLVEMFGDHLFND